MPEKIKPHVIPLILLVLSTFAVYSQTFNHDFLFNWDDAGYITFNEAAKGLSLEHLKAAFTTFYVGNYAPLQIISYMLDYDIWGMRFAGFISTNILLHALNGLFYYALLIKLTGLRLPAFLAGFIFLLHPVQVESVAWISQRKNLLAMFFFLVSFLLYIAYRDSGFGTREPENTTQNSKLKTQNFFYAGSIAAFIFALLAKSVAIVLPPVLLLYDICFVDRKGRGKWLTDKIPYIAVAAFIALVTLKSQSPETNGGITEYHGGGPLATFLTMLPVFARYMGMLLWPANLSAAYSPHIKTGVDLAVILSGLLLMGLCALGFFLYRRRKDLLFWQAVFFIGLLPVAQIVPLVTLMNDRYLYFPMLGAAALLAYALDSGFQTLNERLRTGAAALACLLLFSLPVLSYHRTGVWRDALTLWSDAYHKYPNSVVACDHLAGVYKNIGKIDAAIPLYELALSLAPLDRVILHELASLYMEKREFHKARSYLMQLVETYPDFAEGLSSLGAFYFETRDFKNAEHAYERALKLQTQSAQLAYNLALVHHELKNCDPARTFYHRSLQNGNRSADLFYNLALLEAGCGRTGEAMKHLESAMVINDNDLDKILRSPEMASMKVLPRFQKLLREHALK